MRKISICGEKENKNAIACIPTKNPSILTQLIVNLDCCGALFFFFSLTVIVASLQIKCALALSREKATEDGTQKIAFGIRHSCNDWWWVPNVYISQNSDSGLKLRSFFQLNIFTSRFLNLSQPFAWMCKQSPKKTNETNNKKKKKTSTLK